MTAHTLTATLLATLAVAGAALGAVAPAAGTTSGDGFVYFSTSVEPDQPTTSGNFTFATTFRNVDESTETFRLRRVEVLDGPGSNATVLDEVSYVGGPHPNLPPGELLRQEFSIGFDDPGTHEVVVRAKLLSSRDLFTVTHRTNVTVYRPHPRIAAGAAPTVPGDRTTVNVSVANGLEGEVRDVELALSSTNVSFDERARVASSVAGGASRSFSFTATPNSLGSHPIDATLEYTTENGTRREVTRHLDVLFRAPDLDGDVDVAANVATAMPGTETTLNLTVANGLDRTIRQFEVRIAADGASIEQRRRVGTRLESGAERTFEFAVSRPEAGEQPIDVAVSYTTANGVESRLARTLSTRFDAPANPGEISLTGVDAVQRGGSLELSATASNVGSTDVEAVVVSIGDPGRIAPADFFVGSVEGSDFASFTLTTDVAGNVSSVPVEVTYVVDGLEQSFTTDVAVEREVVRIPDRGGGLPLLPIAGAVVLAALVALAYRWRG